MCGLVGCVGNINDRERRMFHMMLHFDVIRGYDSTGILSVDLKGDPLIIKGLGTPDNLYREFNQEFTNDKMPQVKGSHKLLMGHNRWATVGKVTEENAHPFEVGSIIGCHNGTLSDWHRNKLPDYKDFEVDSENIMHAINELGIKDTIPKMYGAWALTVYDYKQEVLSIIRNDERPLFIVWNKNKNCMFWASEKWMLTTAADKCKVDLDGNPFFLKKDTLIEMSVEKWSSVRPENAIVTKNVKGYELPSYTYNNNNNGGKSNNSRTFPPKTGDKTEGSSQTNTQGNKKELSFSVVTGPKSHHRLSGVNRYVHVWCCDSTPLKDGRIFVADGKEGDAVIEKMIDSEGWFRAEYGITKSYYPNKEIDWQFFIKTSTISEEKSWEFDPETGDPWLPEKKSDKKIDKDGKLIDGMGNEINEETFKLAADNGCIWCSEHISLKDHDKVGWAYGFFNGDSLVCEDCMSNEYVLDQLGSYTQIRCNNIKEKK